MASKKTPLQYLAKVPLFSSCNARDLGKIAKASERVTLKAGTTMITQAPQASRPTSFSRATQR